MLTITKEVFDVMADSAEGGPEAASHSESYCSETGLTVAGSMSSADMRCTRKWPVLLAVATMSYTAVSSIERRAGLHAAAD